MSEKLAYTKVRANGGTQMRAGLNQETVTEYADTMRRNNSYEPFPPIIVYFDGRDYWLGDGFHRYTAALQAFGHSCTIPADIRTGTRRDAILHAAGANADHGVRRTNADKQRAVEALLRDDEWGKWSNREIARRCNVSESFVRSLRTERSDERTYTTKHGKTATMQTGNIGAQHRTLPPPSHRADPESARTLDATVPAFAPPVDRPQPVAEPDPHRAASPPSRQLTDEEAHAVVWRVLERHCDTGKAIAPKSLQTQRDWLVKADWSLFHDALTTGVRFANGQLLQTLNAVKTELEQKIAHFTVNFVEKPQPVSPIVEPEPEGEEEPGKDRDEYYTPDYILEPARRVLGRIDLDPASCAAANTVVKATTYLNKQNDGLQPKIPWLGNVWLNPPYSNPLPWIEKLLAEYEAGRLTAALVLVNTANSPQWARLLWQSEGIVCLLSRRIKFWRVDGPEGKGFDRDQMIFYIGRDQPKFCDVFGEFGAIR